MRLSALLIIACALAACSQSQEDHAREQARQSAEQLKHDSAKALREAEVDARKTGHLVDQDLEQAREKARRALNQPEHPDH
jgi:uncharacterized membrane protein